MRVIAGDLRSRRLLAPPQGVRPTSDRVREALFGRLGDLEGMQILDLFAGTGALGIEALSRGGERATFVEQSIHALRVLRANLENLGLEERCRVVRGEVDTVLRSFAGSRRYDLVFLDPPYELAASRDLADVLALLAETGIVDEQGTVVLERAKRHSLAPIAGFEVLDERSYGDTTITRLGPVSEDR